ncbi:ketopantoate reductase family protein [Membranihabitans maritimus]|uniref:ketopantoate reductase family protein n=1 Tax=Membranihabitans maritimus TaxID=2904244 RepID=UPI001F00CC52|nr:2-dehydropantoate 2-reductase [Membranihabitans maritimus]
MTNQTIYIIGSGAIGKALAVFLQLENKNVLLIRGRTDNQPAEKVPITLTDQNNRKFKQDIILTTFSNLTNINGIVLIATKAFANEDIADKLKDITGDFSVVLLQNGLHIEKPFENFQNVYRGVLLSTSQLNGPHNITFKKVDDSPIGPIFGQNPIPDEIVAQINTPYFGFRKDNDIVKLVWEKVITNCAFNSICPLLETDNGIFHRDPTVLELAQKIIEECVEVATSYQIKLDPKTIENKLLLISQRAEGQLISTYEDIRHKRRTEIDSLNLEITRLAQQSGKSDSTIHTSLLGKMIQMKAKIAMSG